MMKITKELLIGCLADPNKNRTLRADRGLKIKKLLSQLPCVCRFKRTKFASYLACKLQEMDKDNDKVAHWMPRRYEYNWDSICSDSPHLLPPFAPTKVISLSKIYSYQYAPSLPPTKIITSLEFLYLQLSRRTKISGIFVLTLVFIPQSRLASAPDSFFWPIHTLYRKKWSYTYSKKLRIETLRVCDVGKQVERPSKELSLLIGLIRSWSFDWWHNLAPLTTCALTSEVTKTYKASFVLFSATCPDQ